MHRSEYQAGGEICLGYGPALPGIEPPSEAFLDQATEDHLLQHGKDQGQDEKQDKLVRYPAGICIGKARCNQPQTEDRSGSQCQPPLSIRPALRMTGNRHCGSVYGPVPANCQIEDGHQD